MLAIDLMETARDNGFQLRVQGVLFDVVKDRAGAATGDDLNFVNGIVNGETSIFHLAIGVALVSTDVSNDTNIKEAINTLWPFYAKAWTARTL